MEMETQKPKTTSEKISDAFESKLFTLFCLFVLTITLMAHTATLLLSMSVIKWQPYAYFFAVGIDLAILVHAINGHLRTATGLAFIVILLNIAFYNLDTFNRNFNPDWVKFWITLVLSITSGFLVHSYVTIFSDKKEAKEEEKNIYGKIQELRKQLDAQQDELETLRADKVKLISVQAVLSEKEKQLGDMELKLSDKDNIVSQVLEQSAKKFEEPSPMRVLDKSRICEGCGKKASDEASFRVQVQYCNKRGGCVHKEALKETENELVITNN